MDIYSLLKQDHDTLKTLLDRLVDSSPEKDDWKKLIDQIHDELVPHSRAEEALFYNPIRETDKGSSLIAHAYAEHAKAETDLLALKASKAIDKKWQSAAETLRRDLLHHVETEENKVFTIAQSVFTPEEAQQIGEAFTRLKPIVRQQSFAGTSYDLIANLLPKRMRESLHSYFARNFKKPA